MKILTIVSVLYPGCACVVGPVASSLLLFDQLFATAVAVVAIQSLGMMVWAAFAYASRGPQIIGKEQSQ